MSSQLPLYSVCFCSFIRVPSSDGSGWASFVGFIVVYPAGKVDLSLLVPCESEVGTLPHVAAWGTALRKAIDSKLAHPEVLREMALEGVKNA